MACRPSSARHCRPHPLEWPAANETSDCSALFTKRGRMHTDRRAGVPLHSHLSLDAFPPFPAPPPPIHTYSPRPLSFHPLCAAHTAFPPFSIRRGSSPPIPTPSSPFPHSRGRVFFIVHATHHTPSPSLTAIRAELTYGWKLAWPPRTLRRTTSSFRTACDRRRTLPL